MLRHDQTRRINELRAHQRACQAHLEDAVNAEWAALTALDAARTLQAEARASIRDDATAIDKLLEGQPAPPVPPASTQES